MPTFRSAPLVASGHERPVTHLSFSALQPDGEYLLISSCKDSKPMLRDWTGDWIGTFLGHKGAVWSSKLSPDTSKAVTGSADFTAKIWDTSGHILHSFPHNHIVKSVDISSDTQRIVTGGNEKKIRIFDLNRPDADPTFLRLPDKDFAHEKTIKSVVWPSDAPNTVISGGEDGAVQWWDIRTQSPVHTLQFDDPITSLELSTPTATIVLTYGKNVFFHPIHPSGNESDSHTLTLKHAPSSASLHPTKGDQFVAGSVTDEWVRVYNLDDGEEKEVLKGHHGPVHCVMYSPDGEMFASGSEDGTIRLWQTTPGKAYGLWQNGTK